MKKIFLLISACIFILAQGLFATGQTETSSPSNTSGQIHIALIIKATSSSYWQTVIEGAKAYAAANKNVDLKVYGPAAESDVAQSISILENVVESHPDGIVIASQAGQGAVPAVNKAMKEGIPVVTVDTSIPTKTVSFLSTDNVKGGEMAAEQMVKALKENGTGLSGTLVVMHAIVCNTDTQRAEGFTKRMHELAPDVKVVQSAYCNNDSSVAMTRTNNAITAYPNLIGIFGIDYAMGEGISLAIQQAQLQNKVMVVSFDNEPQEIAALKDGTIKALVVQDPYKMGYEGSEFIVDVHNGKQVPAFVDTGVKILLKGNLK